MRNIHEVNKQKAGRARLAALFLCLCVSAFVLGQGGDPRKTNTNSTTTTPKKTTTSKKPPARKPGRTSGSKPTQPSTESTTESTEPELWEAIRNSGDAQDFKDYLQAYPNGAHAVIARLKIRQLEAAKTTTPTNTSPTNLSLSNMPRTRTNQTGIEFVLIPPGSFTMGSTNGSADEKPAHQVTINYSFYMGKYEVTQAQWQSVMGSNPSNFKDCGGNCPVEQVSWDDAIAFIARLNAQNDGYTYRLPTEAEWEYACRAGTTGDYAGDLDAMGWYYANAGDTRLSGDWNADKFRANNNRTHAVGSKLPNAFGLFDMHGNVWEWCQDWYHETYYGAPTDGSAWLSGGEQKYRVLRGGSWNRNAPCARSADRYWSTPDGRNDLNGFRVVAVR